MLESNWQICTLIVHEQSTIVLAQGFRAVVKSRLLQVAVSEECTNRRLARSARSTVGVQWILDTGPNATVMFDGQTTDWLEHRVMRGWRMEGQPYRVRA
jgi:hypothetical protein